MGKLTPGSRTIHTHSLSMALIITAAMLYSCLPMETQTENRPAGLPAEWTAAPRITESPVPAIPGETAAAAPTPIQIDTSPPQRSREYEAPPASAEKGGAWTSAVDGKTMLFIPAGPSYLGARTDYRFAEPDERPQNRLTITAFWIDETEVTNAEYEVCVDARACSNPVFTGSASTVRYFENAAYAQYPVIGVNWYQARDYCAWIGGSLPTEAQWEKAARSPDGRRYPWEWVGSVYNPREEIRLNYCDAECTMPYADDSFSDGYEETAPVGSYPAGASPYGVLDMAGNVWEWTADWYASDHYEDIELENPQGPDQGFDRVIKGGSWMDGLNRGVPLIFRSSNRSLRPPTQAFVDLGFRCVIPVDTD